MASSDDRLEVYIESAKKKTFAGAINWPGWSRSGRDETSALKGLFEYRWRYQQVVEKTGLDFIVPVSPADFQITERLEGNSTTAFGAPDIPLSCEAAPLHPADVERSINLLRAGWQAFDLADVSARGKDLRKGPRGGGRDQEKILMHVLGADAAYLARLGWKFKVDEAAETANEIKRARAAILEALQMAVSGELPTIGPRGGKRWTPRFFVRRIVWHTLDHAWEIEDRIV
jgi:hypothetical protein